MIESADNLGELKKILGERVRAARLQAGMTQRQLGEQVGVSNVSISDWERGISQPSITLLWQLASTLGVSMGSLLRQPLVPMEVKGDAGLENFLELFRDLTPELRRQVLSYMRWIKHERC